MRVAVEQLASSGGPRLPPVTGRMKVCVSQMNGVWCGPEKMGPVSTWLVSVSDSCGGAWRPVPSTVSVFLPTDNPVTTPRTVFGDRPARKARVTSRPFKLTINDWPAGWEISTRTSPPLTRSGQVETVRMENLSCPPAAAACERRIQRTRTDRCRSRVIATLLAQDFVNAGPPKPPAERTTPLAQLQCQDAARARFQPGCVRATSPLARQGSDLPASARTRRSRSETATRSARTSPAKAEEIREARTRALPASV